MTPEEFEEWMKPRDLASVRPDEEWQKHVLRVQAIRNGTCRLPQLPGPEPEMRDQMAGAIQPNSKLPPVIPGTANAVGTAIGWVMGAIGFCILLPIALLPCAAFIGACFIFLPVPAVIIGLIIWAACAADNASTRGIIREELERHDKRRNK